MLQEDYLVGKDVIEYQGFPTKLYVFRSYLDTFGETRRPSNLLIRTLSEHPEIMDPHVFAIAFAFGDLDGEQVEGIDILSARLRNGWEGNPMYDSWTFENGVYVPREKGEICGTGLIVVGEEEGFRRTTSDLNQYLREWADIGNLYRQEAISW